MTRIVAQRGSGLADRGLAHRALPPGRTGRAAGEHDAPVTSQAPRSRSASGPTWHACAARDCPARRRGRTPRAAQDRPGTLPRGRRRSCDVLLGGRREAGVVDETAGERRVQPVDAEPRTQLTCRLIQALAAQRRGRRFPYRRARRACDHRSAADGSRREPEPGVSSSWAPWSAITTS
jgi:hypothetical protein